MNAPTTDLIRTIRLRDHKTTVYDSGGSRGPAVMLIHALGLDHRFWRAIISELTDVARVIAYDVRGHGHAAAAPLTRDIAQLADDARQLLDVLNIEQADVYGASFGGSIAQQLAVDWPKRVRRLALIATADHWPPAEMQRRAVAAESEGMAAQVPEALMRWFLPETIAINPRAVRYARACVRRAKVENWAAAWRAMSTFDLRNRLAAVKVPTLVLSGTQDQSATPAVMADLAAHCGNAELRSIDRGSHMMVLEQPGAVAEELLAFW